MSLGHALRCGLPVPPGFALSADFVATVAGGQSEGMHWVKAHLDDLAGPVAVRSSAVGEDSAEASFAGQHETVLNVNSHESLIEAVCRVFNSAHTDSALAYRRKLGVEGKPRIAVAVQKLIDPECAGVMFTKHPVTAEDEFVIEAAWGLGEAVVSGLVEPDNYRVSRQGQTLESRIGLKDLALRSVPDGGTVETKVPADKIEAACLNASALVKLRDLALECEQHYGEGLDIEWALKDDELYLLQCRAITRTSP